jgi:hypothetical protein
LELLRLVVRIWRVPAAAAAEARRALAAATVVVRMLPL